MMRKWRSQTGTSLIETIVALGVLSVGSLGLAAVFTQGMERSKSSPADLIASQKAQEAIESVFAARDSGLNWVQLRNGTGSGPGDGIFLVGARPINNRGRDGIVNTADDGTLETVTYPGPDSLINDVGDNTTFSLSGFSRKIEIRDLTVDLRSVTVTVTHGTGETRRSYTLTAYLSAYA